MPLTGGSSPGSSGSIPMTILAMMCQNYFEWFLAGKRLKMLFVTHSKAHVEKPLKSKVPSFRGSEATVGISCCRRRSLAALRMTIFNYWLFQQAPKELGHPPFSDGIPVIEKTKAETEVLVRDGITLIIGGLMKNETRKNIRKIPLLGDIPLLGKLFSSTDNQRVKSEIIIFITPHIITGEATQERP